jgi:hypothetical protein
VLVSRQGRFKSVGTVAKKAAIAGSIFSLKSICSVPPLSTDTKLKMMVEPQQELGEFLVTQVSCSLQSR